MGVCVCLISQKNKNVFDKTGLKVWPLRVLSGKTLPRMLTLSG